jgi:hypothetical protein
MFWNVIKYLRKYEKMLLKNEEAAGISTIEDWFGKVVLYCRGQPDSCLKIGLIIPYTYNEIFHYRSNDKVS